MLRSLLLTCALAISLTAFAQTKAPDDPAPAAPAAQGGIQGQNIFDVKPEVKPDASSDPNYMKQSNAERNRVQPGNSAPMWRGVASGMVGYSSLPKSQAPEAGVLIQAPVQYPGSRMTTAGEAWRQVRNNWIIPYGGALFLIMLGALALMYFGKGPLGHSGNEGRGRRIERFTPFERSAHWANAIAFCILAITGLVMAFGKFFLLPVMGGTLFGYLTYLLKNLHNFAGPVFAVSLVIVILTFVRDEFPRRGDLKWLLKLGGVFDKSGHEPPSHRFNAGEKAVFWVGVLFLGIIVVGSGLVMDMLIPNVVYERSTMQIANMIHGVSAVLMMTVLVLHIYLGTIGVRGAYKAMRTGYVDEEWAREHHAYWHEDIEAGKIPAQRSQPLVTADDVETPRTA
jgi:formate dehydrogenase subunit gamma